MSMLKSSKEVAEEYGYCESHIRKLIAQGRIKANKIGKCYVIETDDLPDMSRRRKPNLPKKDEDNGIEQ